MGWNTTELDAITEAHYTYDNNKAWEINYNTSARINFHLKKKAGLYVAASGDEIKCPLAFNEAEGGFFSRGGALSSNYRELVTTVKYVPANVYGNGTIYGDDEIKNDSPEGKVKLVRQQADAAAKKPFLSIARTAYATGTDSSDSILGVTTICSETATQQVGGKAENDISDANGVKPWQGHTYSTAMVISPSTLRARIRTAKVHDSANGKPDYVYMPEDLLNAFKDACQGMQVLGEDKEMTKVGFHNVVFDGVKLVADDFIDYSSTSGVGTIFIENSKYIGFGVYPKADFVVHPWADMLVNGVWGKTMKVLAMLNQITSHRAAHHLCTNVTA